MSTLKPLNLPVQTEDLDEYVKERGLPVLAPVALMPAQRPVPEPSTPKPAPLTKMAIEVPNYLPLQLRKLALEHDCTIRHLVLEALNASGCTIAPEDRQKDGRRTNPERYSPK
jgi:hypothetical protein